MKYLHILTNLNFTYVEAYIHFINRYFNQNEHYFVIRADVTNAPESIKCLNNVAFSGITYRQYLAKVYLYMKRVDFIFLHYLLNDTKTEALSLLVPRIVKKTIWVIWGADLYSWRVKSGFRIIAAIKDCIHSQYIRSMKYVAVDKMDEQTYLKEFGERSIRFHGVYPRGYDIEQIESCKPVSNSETTKTIMIGHSATPNVNHIQTLEMLRRFKDEDIRLILPLNYGNKEYGDEVEQYAREIFSDKAVCLRNRMSMDDYIKLLWAVDVAIFNSPRQIAVGNIMLLLYMEKKLYFPKGSVMYNFYLTNNVIIYNSNSIVNMSFDEFIKPNIEYKQGKEYAFQQLDVNYVIRVWKEIFEILEKDSSE